MKRISLRKGHTIEILGTIFAITTLFLAGLISEPITNLILLVAAWFSLWYFPHCLIHFILGRLVGIHFTHYVIGKTALVKLRLPYVTSLLGYMPVLGIRVDKNSLRQVTPTARRLMFESGALGSMFLPILAVIYSLIYSPTSTSALLIIMTVVNVVLTLYYSPRAGDIWRSRLSYP